MTRNTPSFSLVPKTLRRLHNPSVTGVLAYRAADRGMIWLWTLCLVEGLTLEIPVPNFSAVMVLNLDALRPPVAAVLYSPTSNTMRGVLTYYSISTPRGAPKRRHGKGQSAALDKTIAQSLIPLSSGVISTWNVAFPL